MTERMRDAELERTLGEIGEGLAYPRSSAMASSVRARIASRPRPRFGGFGRPMLPAALTLGFLLLVAAFGPQILRLGNVEIFPLRTTPPAASGRPLPISGDHVSLEQARTRAQFAIRIPTELGAPDDVVIETSGGGEIVTLAYRERAGIPQSAALGAAVLIGEFRGTIEEPLFAKATGPDTKIEPVSINGARGFWLEGAPHLFFYRDPAGAVRQDTLRLAGNTLIWEQDGVTMRLEAQVTKEQAVRIAGTFR